MCTLTNISGRVIENGPAFSLSDSEHVQVLISKDGMTTAPVRVGMSSPFAIYKKTRTYEPGARVRLVNHFRGTVFDDWGFIFSEPGIYRLQLVITSTGRTSTLTSNSVEVKVEEPKGLVADAYRELCAQINAPEPTPLYPMNRQPPPERKCLLNKRVHTAAEVDQAEDFIDDFSATRYAAEVRCHLASYWFRNGDFKECVRLRIKAISGDCSPEVWRRVVGSPARMRQKGEEEEADRLSAAIEKKRARFAELSPVWW